MNNTRTITEFIRFAIEISSKFISKVENGMAKSTETYADMQVLNRNATLLLAKIDMEQMGITHNEYKKYISPIESTYEPIDPMLGLTMAKVNELVNIVNAITIDENK